MCVCASGLGGPPLHVRRLCSTREGFSVRSYISRPMGSAGEPISCIVVPLHGLGVSVGLPGFRGDRGRGRVDYGSLVGFIYLSILFGVH